MGQLPGKWESGTLIKNVTVNLLQYQYYIVVDNKPAWKDKNTVFHSLLHKSVRTDEATMERIKVTEIPIYQKRFHQSQVWTIKSLYVKTFSSYIVEMKLPCDTNVNINSGLLREDKLPTAVNINIFLTSKLSYGPFSNLLWWLKA